MSQAELTLEEVTTSLNNWRFNRRGNESIPNHLWEQIKILLSTYSRGELMRHLRLTTQQFREKGLGPMAQKNSTEISHTFVQIPSAHTASMKSRLTIQRGDTQIYLEHPSDSQIQLILNSLWEQC